MRAIEAHGLARDFVVKGERFAAVRGIDFTVEQLEVFGFLGRNGAGKTTTLRMLATLLKPGSGSATVLGCDLMHDPASVRRRIGFVAQHGGADPTATVRQELLLQGELYRMSKSEAATRAVEIAEMFDLGELMNRPVYSMSGGQRRRLEIALGLIHRPRLVFLDEPTAGLDPHSRAQLWRHIHRLRDEHGITVVLTTHYLEEADTLCDRVMILEEGRVVAVDTPEALKARVAGDVVTVRVAGDVEAAKNAVLRRTDVSQVIVSDQMLRFVVKHDEAAVLSIVRTLDAAAVDPTSVEVARPSLEDVFLAVTGTQLAEDTTEDDEYLHVG